MRFISTFFKFTFRRFRGLLKPQPAESASQSPACPQPQSTESTHMNSDLQHPGSVLYSESQVQGGAESNVYPGILTQRFLSGDADSSSYNVERLFYFFIITDMTYLTGSGCESFTGTSARQRTRQVYCRYGSSREKKTNCAQTCCRVPSTQV